MTASPASHRPPPPRGLTRPLRHLILRAYPVPIRADRYNSQELGLAAFLRREGCEVEVAAAFENFGPGERRSHGLHPLRFFPRHPAAGLVRNLRRIHFGRYDVVQLSDLHLPGNLQVLLTAPRSTRYLVYQGYYDGDFGRGRLLRLLQSRLTAAVLRRGRTMAALAKNGAAADLLERLRLGRPPVVGVGLNIDMLLESSPPPAAVERFLARPGFKVLYVGTIDARRPVEWVASRLREPGLDTVRLLVVGSGDSAPGLRADFRDLEESSRMLCVGHLTQSQLAAVYQAVDCLVLPTRYEIQGMVCLEALLFGLPVIASRVAGPVTIALRFPGSVTLVAPGANPAEWTDALLRAQRESGTAARRRPPDAAVVQALSWQGAGRVFFEAIQQLTGGSNSAPRGVRHA